jgi:predicted nucleotidyltransferase component of viral defense system
MLNKDYSKLYKLQDNFFDFWKTLNLPFYLTGGTALGRFYLNHRYSDDLDFFINNDINFKKNIDFILNQLQKKFEVLISENIIYEDFSRIFIKENETVLKIEFVNDIEYRTGKPSSISWGLVDTPINILSNKLSAIIGREEPKDIFDIIHLSLNYQFNWTDIFYETKNKVLINEIDVEQKIHSFPIQLFEDLQWFINEPDKDLYLKYIKTISNDFITGSDNSLSQTNINISDAKPILIK